MSSTYTEASELEEEFVAWLAELSKGVRWEYMRWLENNDGECDDEDYCVKCVKIQRRVEKHNKTGYTRVSGWNEPQEVDGQRWCARCGVLLCISPTEYLIKTDIEYLGRCEVLSAEDAACINNWLDGNGCYSGFCRNRYWPLIEPHARRLLEAAKAKVTT